MNPKSTWLWLLIAAGLFGAIVLHQHFAPKPQTGPRKLLPGFNPAIVKGVQVQPANGPKLRAERTNGTWRLTEPVVYPVEAGAVDRLLDTLRNLTVAIRITPEEVKNAAKTSAEFGFDPPRTALTIEQTDGPIRLWIGNKTAPGNQVFVQTLGAEEIYVVDADLLEQIPLDANAWRKTELVDLTHITFDRLDVTNAGKTLQLQRAPTNHAWQMIQPSDARADSAKIEDSLRQLGELRVSQFVSDDPKADMDSYGLLNPELSIAFKQGTNTTLALQFGKSITNQPELAYARLDDQKTVVAVPKALFQGWLALHSQDFSDFLDKHLVALSFPPDAIEIRSTNENFTLQRLTNETWRVLPQDFPADKEIVRRFLDALRNMQASRIEKRAVVDFSEFGLATPAVQVIFKNTTTNLQGNFTNVPAGELDFGIKETNVFARRLGEPVVYAMAPTNLLLLRSTAVQFRERRIWKFTANDVMRITAKTNGTSLEVLHVATNLWKVAAGSQGVINTLAVEEVATRLGNLSAAYWVQCGDTNSDRFGFNPEGLGITVELRDRRKFNVEFGGTAPSGFPYARTVLDEKPWIFEFPWDLYQYLDLYLNPSRQVPAFNGPAQ